jgi:hypothetical protein
MKKNGKNKPVCVKPSSLDWRVLMVKHPQTGLYYAAGISLGQ